MKPPSDPPGQFDKGQTFFWRLPFYEYKHIQDLMLNNKIHFHPPVYGITSTNHFSVKLRPLLFTIHIWLYDFDPEH